MKKLTLILAALSFAAVLSAQVKKPTLMIVPSDNWCTQRGFVENYDNQGMIQTLPNYNAAFNQDQDLGFVISKISGIMADRGFPLKNVYEEMKSINTTSAELSALQGKNGGSVQTNTYTEVRNRAKADLILQLNWKVNNVGPKKSVTFNLEAFDAYSNRSVASATGTGNPSFSAETAVLLEEAVNSYMDEFCARLQSYFEIMLEMGREIGLDVYVFDNDEDLDLETEFDGKELIEIIEDWVADNTVGHRYNLVDANELQMKFEEVHVPLYDERGRAIGASDVAGNLRKYLRNTVQLPVDVKVLRIGLGQARIIIGSK